MFGMMVLGRWCELGAATWVANGLPFGLNALSATVVLLDPFDELRTVVSEVLTLVIQITAVLLAISIATGFLEAQIGFAFGAPSLLSNLWVKIGAVVLCLILALTAVTVSNVLVGILF